MADDLARLVTVMETDSAVTGRQRLDDFTASAVRTEKANDALGASSRRGSSALMEMLRSIDRATQEIAQNTRALQQQERAQEAVTATVAASTRNVNDNTAALQRHRRAVDGAADSMKHATLSGVNLSRQFADVGVSLAGGMNPLMVLIQQGPQITDEMGNMARNGTTMGAAFSAMGQSLKGVLVMLAPLAVAAAAIGVAVGTVFSVAGLGARAVNKDVGDLTAGMGLTEKQLERLKTKGTDTGVTIGDVFRGLGSYIGSVLEPAMTKVGAVISDVLDWITAKTAAAIKGIVGGFAYAFGAIRAIWSDLPAIMGDIAVTAANSVIKAAEAMVNKVIAGYNKVLPLIKGMMTVAGQGGLAGALREGKPVEFAGLDNPNQGAASRGMANAAAGGEAARAAALKGLDKIWDDLSSAIVKAAQDRIRKDAGKAEKAKKSPADPRDMSDERTAQIAAQLQAARMDELRAQLDLTRDIRERAKIEREIAAAQLAEKQARVDQQIAGIEDDKGLSRAKKDELILQLAAVKKTQERVSLLELEKIAQAEKVALIRQDANRQAAALEQGRDLLAAQADGVRYAFQRRAIEQKLLERDQQIERLKLREALAVAEATHDAVAIAEARKAIAAAEQRQAVEAGNLQGTTLDQLDRVNDAMQDMASAFESHDWSRALTGLYETLGNFGVDLTKVGGQLGSVLNFLPQAAAVFQGGSSMGASFAKLLGGNSKTGSTFGGLFGGVVGGIASLFGKSDKQKEKEAREQADIASAASKALEIANQHRDLELRIMEASGDEIGALANRREQELAAVGASSQAMLRQIYALEDWQKSFDELTSKVEDARSVLTDAYQRESQALQGTIDTFTQLMASLKAYGQSLAGGSAGDLGIRAKYVATRGQFMAGANDNSQAGLGALQGLSEAYLPAAKAVARTSLDYARAVAEVRNVVGSAAGTAQAQVTVAEQQLSALQASVSGLILVNQSVIGVQQAIVDLQNALAAKAMAEAAKPANDAGSAPSYQVVGPAGYVDQNADLAALYASGSGMARGRSKEEFGLYHWQRYGQAEDRYYRPFARGGAFAGGVVHEPTAFNMGVMGEAGYPEGVLPLTNVGGKLGVHAAGNNAELVAAVRALQAEVASLRADAKRGADAGEKTARHTEKTSSTLTRVTRDGDSLVTEAA